MKKENVSLFANLFGAKGNSAVSEKPTTVVTTSYSQPHVLQQKMKAEKLTHGETVTANISPVRLENSFGKMILYFCPMQSIEILERIADGDGLDLPLEVMVEGITVPSGVKPGLYTLKNVVLSSNGKMQVLATEKTGWEKV